MLLYRSLVDYAQIYAGDRQGFNLGLDNSVFLRREPIPRTFEAPRIGTQGSSLGAAGALTDISAGSDDAFKIAVDGGLVVDVLLTLAGLSTGAAIETELELKINAALAAASQDARVWVFYDVADDHYEVYSQFTGLTSTVVITDATADNVADDLKIGVPNAGTEAAGTDDQDFFLFTTGGPKIEQPIESNAHRSGRYHTGVIKKKFVADFDMDAMLNMSGNAGASIDTAVRLLLENVYGKETVVAAQSITYEQGLPNFTFSMVRVSTIFGEYYRGSYAKDWTLTVPGDNPVTQKFTGMSSKASIAGISQADGAVVASADYISQAGQTKRYTAGAYVMAVSPDGRTVVAGADGSLSIDSIDEGLNKLVLSGAIDLDDLGYLVPWHPGAIQQTGRDNIYTDLEGTFKWDPTGPSRCITNLELALTNDHVDINNCFGSDANQGFVPGNRATFDLSITFDLSSQDLEQIVQAREFGGLSPEITIGDPASGRYARINVANWITGVPPVDVPESGTTPVTLTGTLYQSAPGARDPLTFELR